jgi:hypothetical protein
MLHAIPDGNANVFFGWRKPMITIRITQISRLLLLVGLGLCTLISHAGTITVTPTAADGGTTGLNVTSYTKLFYNIKNTGTSNLGITDVTSSAAEFSVEQPAAASLPVTVPPGGTYLVSVLFKPIVAGARSGTITIASDDPSNPGLALTATGYGGIEQSLRLAPAVPFEIEVNQGLDVRANVTFDNGASGVALLNWTSANPAVAGVTAGADSLFFGTAVPTGKVMALSLGTATLSVSGVTNPNAKATVDVTVVPVSSFEFLATAAPDRVVRIKDGAWSLCYDFPETDIDNRPVYNTNLIGVTTPNFNTIGNAYVTAKIAGGTNVPSEQLFYLNGCNQRTTVYDQPLSQAAFRDLAVDSAGNAVATTDSGFWKMTPVGIYPIALPGLPANDVGALAFDRFDNLYVASYIKTATTQAAAVYVSPVGTISWFPIAVVFNGLIPWSEGILGLAVDSTKRNSIYLMKNSVSRDRALIDRYIDLNGDGSYFKLIGSTIAADPGEIVEIAAIDAGLGLTLDARANIVASVAASEGRSVVKLTDKNNDGDFKDPSEYKVIYQSTLYTQLKDIAFAAPCRDPNIIPYTIPSNGVGEIDEFVTIGVDVSACSEPLKYEWRDETGKLFCTAATCQYLCTGLPAVHKLSLKVTDSTGSSSARTVTVKCGPPQLSCTWPSYGSVYTPILLFGKNFQMAPGTVPFYPVVKFNNGTLLAPISQAIAPDLLFVLQPYGVTQGRITVDTAIGSASTGDYYYSPPSPGVKISCLWHSEARVGNIVFVFGQGFSTVPGANKVTVNGVTAPIVQVLDSTLLVFFVPAGATSGQVCVTVPGYPTACTYLPLVILP